MDIRHYFDEVDFSKYQQHGWYNRKYTIGAGIEKTTLTISAENIHTLEMAIVGAPFDSRAKNNTSDAPDKIRNELYQLSTLNNSVKIADFGNVKPASSLKGNYQALRDIVDYFSELEIAVIIIGGSQDLTVGICEAFTNEKYFSLATIDALLDIRMGKETLNSSNYLSRIFRQQPDLFQFSLIGHQSHFFPNVLFSKTKGINQHLRLGLLRENISLIEPLMRNTDVLSFDIGSVKYSESPGSHTCFPNGLRSEEACQIAKYAGFSNRLKVFGLFDVHTGNDRNNQTVNLSAQVIWYFMVGFSNRIPEDTTNSDNFTLYQVEVKNLDYPLVFLKSRQSNRWWFEIPVRDKEPIYIACSENEYIEASSGEIPALWLKYVQKSDEILK